MAKFTPPSGKEHPPFNGGQKTSCIGGPTHSPGPNGPLPAGNTVQTSNLPNAVTRPPNGIRTK